MKILPHGLRVRRWPWYLAAALLSPLYSGWGFLLHSIVHLQNAIAAYEEAAPWPMDHHATANRRQIRAKCMDALSPGF